MQRQLFFAKNRTSGAWVPDLNDGIKYLQGEICSPGQTSGWSNLNAFDQVS
jgi:hypothetical protein